jgi:hypothetical protein
MAVEIRPVRTRRELGVFVKLPWGLYRDSPEWVPPLLMEVKKRLGGVGARLTRRV